MLELYYPEDKSHVVPPGIDESIDIKTAFKGNAELKADEKPMTNIFDSTSCDNFQLSDEGSFVFYKKNPAGTQLSEKPTNKTEIEKVRPK